MAAAKRLAARVREVEVENPRDFAMARLAAARVSLQASMDAVDEMLAAFVNPDTDKKGRERIECLASALESAGAASRALESAEEEINAAFSPETWREAEPWEGEEEEDDSDLDEEDDEEEEDEEDDE